MNWIKTCAIVSIPILIGFVTLELGIRGIQFFLIEQDRIVNDQTSQIFSDDRDKDYLFWHKPNIRVTLTRETNEFTLVTNKFGHRSLSDKVDFDESIVFLGDSIIMGSSVENNETLSHIVANKLNIPTINLGVGGSNTVQEYYLLKDKFLPEFNMKLLVLGFCLNDLRQNMYRVAFNPGKGQFEYFDDVFVSEIEGTHSFQSTIKNPSKNWSSKNPSSAFSIKEILKNSEAVLFLYRLYKEFGGPALSKEFSLPASAWTNTEYFIQKIANFAETNNSKFLVIIFPTRDQINKRDDFMKQEKLKQILVRNEITYFDPAEAMSQYILTSEEQVELFYDKVHPNKLGTAVIADSFIKFLKKGEL